MKLQNYYKGEGGGEAACNINQSDLLADNTAKATILIEKQRCIYKRYAFYTRQLDRAHGGEGRQAVEYRYIQGYSREETIVFFRRSLSDSPIQRKIDEGMKSVANTLKLTAFLSKMAQNFKHNEGC